MRPGCLLTTAIQNHSGNPSQCNKMKIKTKQETNKQQQHKNQGIQMEIRLYFLT